MNERKFARSPSHQNGNRRPYSYIQHSCIHTYIPNKYSYFIRYFQLLVFEYIEVGIESYIFIFVYHILTIMIPSPVSLRRLRTFDVVPHHLLSVRGLNMHFIQLLLNTADEMKSLVLSKGGDDRLKHLVLAAAFYEPSTRTSCSFQAAMLRLGGSVITVNEEQSSIKKGESLEDTIQTLSCYCDVIVLRHPNKGSAAQAAHVSTKPVINAGDGTGEHPTQALLDLYTIKSELGGAIGGLTADSPMVITLLGDLKNG